MDDRDLLVRGLAAARGGEKGLARKYLQLFLAIDPPTNQQIEALNALAEIAETDSEKRDYVTRVLAFDPINGTARRTLAILDGRLHPDDIVNPDRLPPLQTPPPSDVFRLTCPRCGSGQMSPAPNGTALVCEHCGYSEAIASQPARAVRDQDFYAAMWSAKGHRSGERTRTFV